MTLYVRKTCIVLVVTSFPATILAWPFGAGSCAAGVAAIGGSHLTRANITQGTLEEGGFQVSCNSNLLVSGEITIIDVGQDNTLVLEGGTFKGFLFRLGGSTSSVSTTDSLSVATSDTSGDVQISQDYCINVEKVGGITHTSNSEKARISTILNMAEPDEGMFLDVTVVVLNAGPEYSPFPSGVSEYYYSRYLITASGARNPNTVAPISPDSAAPITLLPHDSPAPIMSGPPVSIAPIMSVPPYTVAPIAPPSPTPMPALTVPTNSPAVTMAPSTVRPFTSSGMTTWNDDILMVIACVFGAWFL